MLLKLLQIIVRGIFYVVITWYRFAPDGSGKAPQASGRSNTPRPAKRGA